MYMRSNNSVVAVADEHDQMDEQDRLAMLWRSWNGNTDTTAIDGTKIRVRIPGLKNLFQKDMGSK